MYEFLSAKEARCLVGLSQREWTCLIESGEVPSKEVAGWTFYPEDSLVCFIDNNPMTVMTAIHDAALEKAYHRVTERERETALLALYIASLHQDNKPHAA